MCKVLKRSPINLVVVTYAYTGERPQTSFKGINR